MASPNSHASQTQPGLQHTHLKTNTPAKLRNPKLVSMIVYHQEVQSPALGSSNGLDPRTLPLG